MPANILTTVKSSAVGALRLLLEKPTTDAPTLSFVVIEPTEQISHERLQRLVASSLPQLTHFRSRLVDRPLGVGPPFWAEIERYDPSSQIHRATVRAPGGHRELAALIAQLSSEPRLHSEMLWEAWSIDGLSGGRWALVVRLSPVLNERGVAAAAVWSRLLHSDPHHGGGDDQLKQPGPVTPAVGELATEVITEILEFQFKALFLVAETVSGLLRSAWGQLGEIYFGGEHDSAPAVSSTRGPLPLNAFTAPLTERRAVAFASVWQADLETVSTAFGGDVTNVLLAACTLSLRAWLQRHGSVPDEPLVMWMPLTQSGAVGQIRVPVQLNDPVEVLTNLHTATERMSTAQSHDDERDYLDSRCQSDRVVGSVDRDGCGQASPQGTGCAATADADHARQCLFGPGKAAAHVLCRAEVVGMHTVAPLVEGCGLTITPTSHGEEMHLSVCVCPDNVPEVDEIAAGIVDAVGILVAAARKSPRGQGRSVVTEMTAHANKRGAGPRLNLQ